MKTANAEMRSKEEIEKFLAELTDPKFRKSGGCNMGYEYQATIDTLKWVLGLRESTPLAGRRNII